MSSNVTLVDKLNPRRPEPNKMQFQISEKFAKSLPKKNNTVKNIVQKESFSINDISSTKVSINNIENKNKSVEEDEKDSIDLEDFYVKYLLKLNHLINGTKKKLL